MYIYINTLYDICIIYIILCIYNIHIYIYTYSYYFADVDVTITFATRVKLGPMHPSTQRSTIADFAGASRNYLFFANESWDGFAENEKPHQEPIKISQIVTILKSH